MTVTGRVAVPAFCDAGRLLDVRAGQSVEQLTLARENEELKAALGEAHVELRVWKRSAEHRLGPTRSSR